VANAINYTTSGSVKLSAMRVEGDTAEPVKADVVRILFTIVDTGAGISRSEQTKLWQPYVRGGAASTLVLISYLSTTSIECNTNNAGNSTATSGTGLGLFIAKLLVEGMGGELSLRSGVGEGSSFYFTLAFKTVPQLDEVVMISGDQAGEELLKNRSSEMATRLSEKRHSSQSLHRKSDFTASVRILIVDDAPVNCKLLARTFGRSATRLGIAAPIIVIAINGQIAVDLVRKSLTKEDVIEPEVGSFQPRFDLICLDRQMPVMCGVTASRQIKELQDDYFNAVQWMSEPSGVNHAPKPAYVVGMSASIDNLSDWLTSGVDELLPKPFATSDIDHLLLAMYSSSISSPVPPGRTTKQARRRATE
jgi:CheY-like chemotaxis protein